MTRFQRRDQPRPVQLPLPVRMGLASLLVILSMAAPTYGQLQRGPYGPEHVGAEDVDRRITWLHWWEANRESYLMRALNSQDRAKREKPHDAQQVDRAVEILIAATRLDDRASQTLLALRTAATFSLGRIGTDDAVARLIELTRDRRHVIRSTAWLALGVSGHERARRALLEAKGLRDAERTARAAALGLLEPGDKEAIEILTHELVDLPLVSDKRVVLQSLRLLRADAIAALGYEVIHRTTSPNLASEAILAMAADPQPAHADLVLSLLNGGPPASRLGFDEYGRTPATRFAAAYVLDRYEGMYPVHRLERVLSKHVFLTTFTGEGDYYRGVSLLSLVAMIEPEDEDVMTDALAGRTRVYDREDVWRRREDEPLKTREFFRLHDPVRGYAAIAMGSYLDLFNEDPPQERPYPARYEHEIDRAQRRFIADLGSILKFGNEPSDLRAAAAMGLAFSHRPEAANLIVEGLEHADPEQDILVVGYGSLALALLGDDRAAVYAKQYLAELDASRDNEGFDDDNPVEQVLGLRAMALALGLVGDEHAAASLIQAWGADPWVSLESARALNWLEDNTLADALIDRIQDEPDDADAVLAAMGLGVLLDPMKSSRVARLVESSNFTINEAGTAPANVAEADHFYGNRRTVACIRRWQRAFSDRAIQSPGNVYLYEVMLQP